VTPISLDEEPLTYTNLHFDGFSAEKIPITAVKAKKAPHQIPVPMDEISSSPLLTISNT